MMRSPFKKKLYSVTNGARNKIFIIAEEEETAKIVAQRIKFLRSTKNYSIKDVSDEYMTYERYKDGLNYDELDNGRFIQKIIRGRRKWTTSM